MGCQKLFTDRRIFMFNNTLMKVLNRIAIFTRLDYPLAMINSTITKTIQSFSFGTREKNEVDSSVVRVSLPFKDQTSLSQRS